VPPGFEHAADLVAALASRHPFEISVAAHPEKHPEALSLDADIDFLKRKIDAGASRAYCQFVLDPEIYGRFLDACGKRGIGIPIVPGLMPLDNWPRVRRFAIDNGAGIPGWLDQLFAEGERTPALMPHLATALTVEHARRLIAYGAPELHVYTMNRWELPLLVAHLLGHTSQQNASNGT
jgi:methylenetetrahydrofolate reductase (NADPH)